MFTPVSCISLRSQGCHKDEVNVVTLTFRDIIGCKTVVSAFFTRLVFICSLRKDMLDKSISYLLSFEAFSSLLKHPQCNVGINWIVLLFTLTIARLGCFSFLMVAHSDVQDCESGIRDMCRCTIALVSLSLVFL